MAQAIFAGGCFWCTEAVFNDLKGVSAVESGYIGGSVANPLYKAVCSGMTGHAEAIRVTYDPAVISYADLADIFMVTHDPTAAAYADRAVFLADGRIVDEMHEPTADRVLERMKAFEAGRG